jgi:nucleoside-diphosphate-sugar epimerase
MARCLVTGGCGFIGSHIVRGLLDAGHRVRVLDNLSTGKRENLDEVLDRIELIEGDINDPIAVKEAISGVERVFHQAALASVQMSLEKPLDTNHACVTGTLNMLHHSMQAKATNTVVGGAFSYNVNRSEEDPVNVYVGSWYRFNDSFIPYVGLEFKGFRLGASYDANTSLLRPATNTRGGMEISLIYIKQPPDPRGIPCPKF